MRVGGAVCRIHAARVPSAGAVFASSYVAWGTFNRTVGLALMLLIVPICGIAGNLFFTLHRTRIRNHDGWFLLKGGKVTARPGGVIVADRF